MPLVINLVHLAVIKGSRLSEYSRTNYICQMRLQRRQVILTLIGIGILAAGIAGMNALSGRKKPAKVSTERPVPGAYIQPAQPGPNPIVIHTSGPLLARDRMDIFAEVQGNMLPGTHPFKEGRAFRKGEILLQLDDREYAAGVRSQKSNLQSVLSSVLADIELDFPKAYARWESFASQIDVGKPLPPLPDVTEEQLRFFLSSRNVFTNYYNVRNAEIRLDKYRIYAPYDGVVTRALVNRGTLVRQGQALGEFIRTGHYELALPLPPAFVQFLSVGQKVALQVPTTGARLRGEIIRINGKVNAESQTRTVYVGVSHPLLQEGMYTEAEIQGKTVDSSLVINRSLLDDQNRIYTVENGRLTHTQVEVVHFMRDSVLIHGLKSGTMMVTQPVPGAHPGMAIKPL